MLENNNKDVIKLLNKRMLNNNRLRNLVAIIAIVLTTFMFTTIYSIGFSMVNNLNEMLLLGQGSKAAIYLDNPTEKQLEEVRNCDTVDAAGQRIRIEIMKDKSGKSRFGLMWFDRTEFEKNLKPAIREVEGTYPEKENEIMLSRSHLSDLGYEGAKIGDKVVLYLDGEANEFVISGIYHGFSSSNPCLVSYEYALAQGKTVEGDGFLAISSKNSDNSKTLEELGKKVLLNPGQKWDNTYDNQSEKNSTTIAMIFSVSLISLLIVISGYLLIYNVMYISVAKDTRFYGMLKTIGTSSKQIMRLVRYQAFSLSAIGIPLGLILASLTSFAIVPLSMDMIGTGRSDSLSTTVTFNVWIYLFAIIFAIITVFMSVRKPAKLAAKVSPIEALRYYGEDNKKAGIKVKRKSEKTYSESQKVRSMAFRNVFRDRKRSRLVWASLFFGTMVFLCVNTFINSLSAENYINSYFYYDYALYGCDEVKGNPEADYDIYGGRTFSSIAKEIETMEGIDYFHANRYAYATLDFKRELYRPFLEMNTNSSEEADILADMYEKENEVPDYGAPLIAVPGKMLEIYNKKAKHKIDIDRFEKGEICLVGYVKSDEQSEQFTGKTITIKNSESGKTREIEVGATATKGENNGIVAGFYWVLAGAPQVILVSDTFMDDLFPDAVANTLIANAKPGMDSELAQKIYRIYEANECVEGADIRSLETEDFKKSMLSLTIIGGGISFILILIGLMNYINVMLTSVYTRSKEIASLESVGMTKKQIKKMLVWEGEIYGGISIGLILTLGSIMIYVMGRLTVSMADYAVATYPVAELVFLIVMIIVICSVTPILIFKEISQKTVTERIRE